MAPASPAVPPVRGWLPARRSAHARPNLRAGEAAAQPRAGWRSWPVVHRLLATRPAELDRPSKPDRQDRRLLGGIALELATERPAMQRRVDRHARFGQAGCPGDGCARGLGHLGRHPDFNAVALGARRRHHRLDRAMRRHRNGIVGGDGAAAAEQIIRVAPRDDSFASVTVHRLSKNARDPGLIGQIARAFHSAGAARGRRDPPPTSWSRSPPPSPGFRRYRRHREPGQPPACRPR